MLSVKIIDFIIFYFGLSFSNLFIGDLISHVRKAQPVWEHIIRLTDHDHRSSLEIVVYSM